MKVFLKSLFCLLSLTTTYAQNAETIVEDRENLSITPPRKSGVKFSLGYSVVHLGDLTKSGLDKFKEFGNIDYSNYPSAFTFGYYAKNGMSYDLTGSFNEIKEKKYYGIDGKIHYNFGKSTWVVDPSIHVGGGYTFYDKESSGHVGGGLGLSFWVTETFGLNLLGTYKHQIERDIETNLGIPSHFQFIGSIVYRDITSDRDKDGVYDDEDECPDVPGLKEFNGCPDTDGDGIPDYKDECPNIAGLAEFNGCPDSDGDGIEDRYDNCPQVAGLKEFKGCPDTDGDGIVDHEDKCPNVFGLKEFNGCPDTDGDGVVDHEDKCPNEPGRKDNNGCPVNVLKTVQNFNISKFNVKDEIVLQEVVEIAKKFSDINFVVEGHTDSIGDDKYNYDLSVKRAESVKAYLVKNGINADRLEVVGYGAKNPASDNKTKDGRADNRRTVIISKK